MNEFTSVVIPTIQVWSILYSSTLGIISLVIDAIEIWMKDYLVSGSNRNICRTVLPSFFKQGLSNKSRFTFSVGDTTRAICD